MDIATRPLIIIWIVPSEKEITRLVGALSTASKPELAAMEYVADAIREARSVGPPKPSADGAQRGRRGGVPALERR